MKIRISLALMLLSVQALQADTFTYTDTWEIGRATTLQGTQDKQTITDTAKDTSLLLPFYQGSLALQRVQIIYTLPLAGISGTATSTLSVSEGTSHFASASFGTSTQISSAILFAGLNNLGYYDAGKFDINGSLFKNANSTTATNFDLTNPATKDFSVERSNNTVVFDTSRLDASELDSFLSYFTQAGNFGLEVDSSVQIDYVRSGSDTGTVTLVTQGKDSGTVKVIYYTAPTPVPEPTTWAMLMGGLGMVVLGQRLRHRAN